MELPDLVRRDYVPDQAEGEQAPGTLQTPTGRTGTWRSKLCCTNKVYKTSTCIWEERIDP